MCAQGMYFRDKCVFQSKMFTVCSATDNHSRLFKMSIPFPLTFFSFTSFLSSFLFSFFLSIKVRRGSLHWTNVVIIFPFFFYSLFSINALQIYASPSRGFFLQGGHHFFYHSRRLASSRHVCPLPPSLSERPILPCVSAISVLGDSLVCDPH